MPIGRSSTGTYHNVLGGASVCNGRSFRGAELVDQSFVEAAPEEMFCKNCFNINPRDKTRKGNALFHMKKYQK